MVQQRQKKRKPTFWETLKEFIKQNSIYITLTLQILVTAIITAMMYRSNQQNNQVKITAPVKNPSIPLNYTKQEKKDRNRTPQRELKVAESFQKNEIDPTETAATPSHKNPRAEEQHSPQKTKVEASAGVGFSPDGNTTFGVSFSWNFFQGWGLGSRESSPPSSGSRSKVSPHLERIRDLD